MSYILDALVKAERERHLGQAPRLDDAPPRATAEPAESPGWWQAASTIIAAALVVATLLFVFLREPAAITLSRQVLNRPPPKAPKTSF